MRHNIGIHLTYVVYLLLVSSLVSLTSPCFAQTGPVEYHACNIEILVNNYLTFIGIGLVVAAFSSYLYTKTTTQKLSDFISTCIGLGMCAVLAYYVYLPFAMKQIAEVEIYLDSVL